MSKKILRLFLTLMFLLCLSLNPIIAQNTGIGIKAGLDFSTQLNNFKFNSGDLTLNLSPTFTSGYQIGLIYRNRIAKNFRIQAEPSLLRIGARYNESFTFRNFEFQTDSETKLLYAHLPVVLELTTTPPDLEEFPKPWEETTYHLTLGIYSSYLVDATFSGINSGSPLGVDFEEEFSNDVTSQFNKYDVGFIIGGGFEYGYQNKIGIESRLIFGVIDSNESNNNKIRLGNLWLSFAMYYLF